MKMRAGPESQGSRSAASPQEEDVAERLLGQILHVFERPGRPLEHRKSLGSLTASLSKLGP